MTSRTNIIIAISAIAVFAAVVGFFITLDASPQIAYARLFIDAGLVIGLVAVVMAFYREKELPLKSFIDALRSLRDGHYKARLEETGALADIAKAINELSVTLANHHEKQEEIKRNLREELLPDLKPKEVVKEVINSHHSLHPELGPVLTIPEERVKHFQSNVTEPVPMSKNFASLSNTLIDSHPPKIASKDILPVAQDLGELYERFVQAQRELNLEKIEYHQFLKTIENTRQELMSSHKCQGIMFDIVAKAEQVALQPKIIR